MRQRVSDKFEVGEPIPVPVDDKTAWLLGQGLRAMHLSGEEGVREYAHVIHVLRADAEAAARVADEWIRAASVDPMLRWSLLCLLAEIEDPACIGVLAGQATRELPKRVREPGVCEQTSDVEELVAVMAIEALGRLAQAGDEKALDVLLTVIGRQDRASLRQPAVAAVLAARADLRERVGELLPEDARYLLDLREATEEDLRVELAHESRDRKSRRRETRPKPPLLDRGTGAPQAPCRR